MKRGIHALRRQCEAVAAKKQKCPVDHDALRVSLPDFVAMTERLPHRPHEEAYLDGGDGTLLWHRNCRVAFCKTTIIFVIAADARRAA